MSFKVISSAFTCEYQQETVFL